MDGRICIYHGNCADGFTAAWVVKKVFPPASVHFWPGVYYESPPEVEGMDVVMVDFSYKRPVMEEILRKCKSFIWLDHHKSAIEDMAGFGEGDAKFKSLTDLNRSGAGITWDYFNPGIKRPELVFHVEDRDLWKFVNPMTRPIQACVFSYEYTFENWDKLAASEMEHLANDGLAIERKHFKDIKELVTVTKRMMEIGGHTVPVASLPYTLPSDAGHMMAEGFPFAACYWDTAKGRVFSLRSRPEGMDVSEIAKLYGGGGHKNASGFTVIRSHELAIA